MIFYTFIIVLSGTLAWWAQKLPYKLISRTRITVQDIFLNYFTYILIVLSALPYFFTMTFRYGIGTDYFITYYPTFVSASNPSIWHPHVETLYLFINNLVASFTNQFGYLETVPNPLVQCYSVRSTSSLFYQYEWNTAIYGIGSSLFCFLLY